MIDKAQRYPTMTLPTLRDNSTEQQQVAYNRELTIATWRLLKLGTTSNAISTAVLRRHPSGQSIGIPPASLMIMPRI
jgi:hypothetical protein